MIKGAPKLPGSVGRPATNRNGFGSHPGKRNIVRNAPGQPTQLGRDKFKTSQAKPRIKVV